MEIEELPGGGNRQIIQAYGGGGFRISGRSWTGSVLVFVDRTIAWPPLSAEEVDAGSLARVAAVEPRLEILLLGCGPTLAALPPTLRGRLGKAGPVVDAMDTGAACRTFNVLAAEGRRVAAALLALD
jgi:uncharacterized protein